MKKLEGILKNPKHPETSIYMNLVFNKYNFVLNEVNIPKQGKTSVSFRVHEY